MRGGNKKGTVALFFTPSPGGVFGAAGLSHEGEAVCFIQPKCYPAQRPTTPILISLP